MKGFIPLSSIRCEILVPAQSWRRFWFLVQMNKKWFVLSFFLWFKRYIRMVRFDMKYHFTGFQIYLFMVLILVIFGDIFLPNTIESLFPIGVLTILFSCNILYIFRNSGLMIWIIGILSSINIVLAYTVCLKPYESDIRSFVFFSAVNTMEPTLSRLSISRGLFLWSSSKWSVNTIL